MWLKSLHTGTSIPSFVHNPLFTIRTQLSVIQIYFWCSWRLMIKLWSNDTIGIILELPLCQLLTFSQWVTRYGVVKEPSGSQVSQCIQYQGNISESTKKCLLVRDHVQFHKIPSHKMLNYSCKRLNYSCKKVNHHYLIVISYIQISTFIQKVINCVCNTIISAHVRITFYC